MQRPTAICNEEQWQRDVKTVVETAQSILKKELGIIEGARKLSIYRFKVKAEDDKDFIFFVGLDSETDALAVGQFQTHWNSAVLKQKQAEIERFEKSVEQKVFDACNNLIAKYGF